MEFLGVPEPIGLKMTVRMDGTAPSAIYPVAPGTGVRRIAASPPRASPHRRVCRDAGLDAGLFSFTNSTRKDGPLFLCVYCNIKFLWRFSGLLCCDPRLWDPFVCVCVFKTQGEGRGKGSTP
jgi:hypothetical protein